MYIIKPHCTFIAAEFDGGVPDREQIDGSIGAVNCVPHRTPAITT